MTRKYYFYGVSNLYVIVVNHIYCYHFKLIAQTMLINSAYSKANSKILYNKSNNVFTHKENHFYNILSYRHDMINNLPIKFVLNLSEKVYFNK